MTQLQLVADLTDGGTGFLFWMSAVFPFAVSVIWPWWLSTWGRNIVSFEIAISCALLPSTIYNEFGIDTHSYVFDWFTVAGLYSAGTIVGWRMILIFKDQYRTYRKDEEARENGGV